MNPDRLIRATTRPKKDRQRRFSPIAIIAGVAILMLVLSWTCIGATIGDLVWLDSNMDGIQDQGEPELPYVLVYLYNSDSNLVAYTYTDQYGRYQFDVPPGNYYLWFYVHPITYKDCGQNDALDSDAGFNGVTEIFTVSGSDLRWDCGVWVDLSKVPPFSSPISGIPPYVPPTDKGPIPGIGPNNGPPPVITPGPNGSNGSNNGPPPMKATPGIDVHFSYVLIDANGNYYYGAIDVKSGYFEYGVPIAMSIQKSPGASTSGRKPTGTEASVTFSEPTGGSFFPDVSSVVGGTDTTVQITAIQWTYYGKPIGPVFTADPSLRGEPQGSKNPCESFAARIETDKSSYSMGEHLVITFYVSEKAEVTLYDHLPNGKIQIMPLGTVSAGTHRLPGPGQSLTITEPAGVETVELRVTSESGCTASVRTSFTVVSSGPRRPTWVEPCTRELARASGIEYKEEGTNYSISRSQYMSFMVRELQIFETSVHPSVTAQMKQCAASLLNYLQQASSTEQSDIAQIFIESYYQTRR